MSQTVLRELFPDHKEQGKPNAIQSPKHEHELEMWDTIQAFEQRAWSPNNKGFLTGFTALDEALDGLQTGFHMVGGQSNTGKTSFISQMAWNVATLNDNAYVIDFSLDDPIYEKIPRIIASSQKVLINAVKAPNNFATMPEMLNRRKTGINTLKSSVDRYKAYDSNHGSDIDRIEETIRMHATALEAIQSKRRIIVFIDNFHDLTTISKEAQGNDKNKYDYIAQKISDIATVYDIPIVCTGEFRKLNGYRRPTPDDLRESIKIVYEAKSILLVYNEVGLKGEAAAVHFLKQGSPSKQPVLEIKIDKNKYTSFKGRLFYEFYPEMAYFEEADQASSKRYNNLVYSNT